MSAREDGAPEAREGSRRSPRVDDAGDMLDATGHSAESPLAQRPNPATSEAGLLKMENAALIDGLRALNEQVKRLEADRTHLIEAAACGGGQHDVQGLPGPGSTWRSHGSGESIRECLLGMACVLLCRGV